LRSNSLTAVLVPEGKDSAGVMRAAERLHLSLGTGLGRLRGRAFRIGHLGSFNELEAVATVAGVEMACAAAGIPVNLGAGPAACQRYFMEEPVAAAFAFGASPAASAPGHVSA
jgi:alanine-glyoxylate transaminase/serine-glyoxylate transaminase/serine-pyruvate transaminase